MDGEDLDGEKEDQEMNISQAFKPRTPEPVTCSGYELASVLSGIRARGGFVNGLEAGVGGKNAIYKVSYFERVASGKDDGAGSARTPVRQLTALKAETPSTLAQSPHQCETPENTAAPNSVKGAVAPRNCSNDPKSPCYGSASKVVGDETAGVVSIESRMNALQQRLRESGKLKRSKPSSKPEHARLPHPND